MVNKQHIGFEKYRLTADIGRHPQKEGLSTEGFEELYSTSS
jgi:hypothetical protein